MANNPNAREIIYQSGPSLEEGGIKGEKEVGEQNDDGDLPFLSSVLKELHLESKSALPDLSTIPNMMNKNSSSHVEIPYLDMFNDPLHFLQKQEKDQKLLLEQLEKTHRDSLSAGSKNVNTIRLKLLSTLNSLSQGCQAMREIYTSDSSEKSDKINKLSLWEGRKKEILQRVADIERNSSTGKSYRLLLDKMNETDNEVLSLESKLAILKNKRKLIGRELMEAKSLLDVKVNSYIETLKQLETKKIKKITELQVDGSLPQGQMSTAAVIENMQLQVEAVNDMVETSHEQETKCHDSYVYLSDVFDTLIKSEESLGTFIHENRPDLIKSELLNIKCYLSERLEECGRLHMTLIKSVIQDEYSTIVEALRMIGIQIPTEPDTSPSRSPEESFEEVQASDVSSTTPSFRPPALTTKISKENGQNSVHNVVVQGNIILEKSGEKMYADILARMKGHKGTKKD
ncbi:hypothetical protein FOA43_003776 [Brettanomyces nanus]|uniref:Uncharacterized protein n=1 Tax=Eeniella nana TaxID=13502 RepID=A0A875RWM3_EENNA|nr:uncharacterized protein FOA43_003776 [Brettanomyces nanus]QPG76387.1 hypothetical protein FOA43_003776 [Brettanomyces nanus]